MTADRCSDNQVAELLALASKLDISMVMDFKRTTSRSEHGAPWFVWVALANDGTELGRSDEFRFIAGNVPETMPGAAVAKMVAAAG